MNSQITDNPIYMGNLFQAPLEQGRNDRNPQRTVESILGQTRSIGRMTQEELHALFSRHSLGDLRTLLGSVQDYIDETTHRLREEARRANEQADAQAEVQARAERDVEEARAAIQQASTSDQGGDRSYTRAAQELDPAVQTRLKEVFNSPEGGECPICVDTPDEKDLIVFPCGHTMCIGCLDMNCQTHPNDFAAATKCHSCRVLFDPRKCTTKKYVTKVYGPSTTPETPQAEGSPAAEMDDSLENLEDI